MERLGCVAHRVDHVCGAIHHPPHRGGAGTEDFFPQLVDHGRCAKTVDCARHAVRMVCRGSGLHDHVCGRQTAPAILARNSLDMAGALLAVIGRAGRRAGVVARFGTFLSSSQAHSA